MFINEIKIMKRRNLGNYEHKEVTMGVALKENDNHAEALALLEANIEGALFGTPVVPKAPVPSDQTEMDIPVDVKEAVKKVTKAKKAKAPKKAKEPVVVPTLEEVQVLCRDVATKLKSADKVKALITECCGVGSLGEVKDTACFIDLAKKLKDA